MQQITHNNPGKQTTSTLLDRIEWILRDRRLTHEQLSHLSGFNSRSHVSMILYRLRKNPAYEKKMSAEIFDKLARGAHVSRAWLQYGEGSPNAPISEPTGWSVNLDAAIRAEASRWSRSTIAAARALVFEKDPTRLEWIAILDRFEEAISAELARLMK